MYQTAISEDAKAIRRFVVNYLVRAHVDLRRAAADAFGIDLDPEWGVKGAAVKIEREIWENATRSFKGYCEPHSIELIHLEAVDRACGSI